MAELAFHLDGDDDVFVYRDHAPIVHILDGRASIMFLPMTFSPGELEQIMRFMEMQCDEVKP